MDTGPCLTTSCPHSPRIITTLHPCQRPIPLIRLTPLILVGMPTCRLVRLRPALRRPVSIPACRRTHTRITSSNANPNRGDTTAGEKSSVTLSLVPLLPRIAHFLPDLSRSRSRLSILWFPSPARKQQAHQFFPSSAGRRHSTESPNLLIPIGARMEGSHHLLLFFINLTSYYQRQLTSKLPTI